MINLLSEKHITNAHVYIEGEKTEFVSLELEQVLGEHHGFSVVLDYDRMKKPLLSNPLEQLKLIGKLLDIDLLQGADSSNVYEFRGIICDVSHEAREGRHGFLIIEGMSPTVLLERGKRLDIFSNMDLKQVFDEVTAGVVNKNFSCVNQPVYSGQVDFLMQYQESDWEFLQRLSSITGETLFYTGRDLVFGEYKDWKETTVTYDEEITQVKFGSRLLPNHFTRYQYLAEKDDTIEQEAPVSIENANDYINAASDGSKELTEGRPFYSPVSLPVNDKGALDEMAKREKTTNASRSIYVKGKAKTCVARIGRLLTIGMPKDMPQAKSLGTYRVIKVKHIIDQNHRYSGEFEAIPAELKFMSLMEPKIPAADSVIATVTKNVDPQGQGRILVEFPFAKDRVNETWIRVMTQDAGLGDEEAKNRGMVSIPEIGDQVMIGFEFGDPNRPYVMGSMFHGKNTENQGGGEGNHIKTFTDKSGSYYKFNSKEGSIELYSKKGGSKVNIDGQGNITISTPNTITISATDININASNSINLKAEPGEEDGGGTITAHADKSITVTAQQEGIRIEAKEKDITIKAKTELAASSEDANINLQAAKEAKMDATDIKIGASSTIRISSSDTDIM